MLEEAIKRQVQSLYSFQLEISKYLVLVPEGLDAQSSLFSLPPFSVLRSHIADLQKEFDIAHQVRDSDDIMHWLHLEVRLLLDPFATLSVRKNKAIMSTKATILNHLSSMMVGIDKMRSLAITDMSLERFVEVMQNHHVLPKPGRRRDGKVKNRTKVGPLI